MDILNEYRAIRNQQIEDRAAKAEAEARDKSDIESYDKAVNTYLDKYTNWAKNNNGKFAGSSRDDIEKRIREFVKTSGAADGQLTKDSSDADVARYGAGFLNNLSGLKEDGSEYTFKDYLEKYGDSETKSAVARQLDAMDILRRYRNNQDGMTDSEKERLSNANATRDRDMRWLGSARTQYNTWQKSNSDELYDIFENYETYMPKKEESNNTAEQASTTSKDGSTAATSGDEVTFQLDRANDPNYKGFGQKIVDLGLATDKGLWGSNGDVAFYTQQLYDQGALDANGNLKIGVPIKLKRRK
jgi:hypothetical protein